eukprot:15318747-Alexandrium_andersonii.AAC.1
MDIGVRTGRPTNTSPTAQVPGKAATGAMAQERELARGASTRARKRNTSQSLQLRLRGGKINGTTDTIS